MLLLQSWNCCYRGVMGMGSSHHNLSLLSQSGNINSGGGAQSFLPTRRRRRKTGSTTTTTTDSSTSTSSSKFGVVCVISSRVGIEDIAEIAHNKVLVAAVLSSAIGQLSKPFTSAILYGNNSKTKNKNKKKKKKSETQTDTTVRRSNSSIKDFNFRSLFQAGGFPSSHSSAVVATATSLGLERGFSDLIFGLAVVYAGIIMYDAQGVRREVGTHAKALNRVLLLGGDDDDDDAVGIGPGGGGGGDLVDDSITIPPGKASFINSEHPDSSSENGFKPINLLMMTSDNKGVNLESSLLMTSTRLAADDVVDVDDDNVASSSKFNCYSTPHPHPPLPLNESVGHTLTEVIAGALLGFFVSLAVSTII